MAIEARAITASGQSLKVKDEWKLHRIRRRASHSCLQFVTDKLMDATLWHARCQPQKSKGGHRGLGATARCMTLPINRAQTCNQPHPNLAISRVALLGIVSKITQHIE